MFGTRIIESFHMVDPVEDWSRVRSPARAARRRKKHRQNIRTIYVPKKEAFQMPDGSLVMHPEMARALRDAVKPAAPQTPSIMPTMPPSRNADRLSLLWPYGGSGIIRWDGIA
jgi:hypothetical protein